MANVNIPVLRDESPYIGRRYILVPVRTLVLALVAAGIATGAIALAWAVLPTAAAETGSAVVSTAERAASYKPSTTGMPYPRTTPSYDAMYAPGAETRSVDDMYAKPRSRRFDR